MYKRQYFTHSIAALHRLTYNSQSSPQQISQIARRWSPRSTSGVKSCRSSPGHKMRMCSTSRRVHFSVFTRRHTKVCTMKIALSTCLLFLCAHSVANAQTEDYLADPESDAVSNLRELLGDAFFDLKDKTSPSRRSRPSTVPHSRSMPLYATQGWDYRFDAQYQLSLIHI